jgi:ABC-2 type transport system permease protein
MTTDATSVPESHFGPKPSVAAPARATRPFYWSVRRELWENRSIYIAPIAVAVLNVIGYAFSTVGMPDRRRAVLLLEPVQQRARIEQLYDMAAMMLIATAFLVGVFYCLDALHGERRDRSILFWKSLPVSDLTAVLSKLSIPLLILPVVIFAVTIATQVCMYLWMSLVLLANGLPLTTYSQLPLFHSSIVLFYGLTALALWHAPIYAWLLAVSACARRAVFLWAVLPPLALAAVERITFHTAYLGAFIKYRLVGGMSKAFAFDPHGSHPTVDLPQLTPGSFLSTPGVWLGLVAAAAFLAAAVWLRRSRGPL